MADGKKGSGRRLVLLVLGVLAEGPAHGYGIVRKVGERSDGVLRLEEGLVYPLLHELEQAGLVAGHWEEAGARRRKVYSLTVDGAARYATEFERWQAETDAVRSVLRPSLVKGGHVRLDLG